MLARAKQSVDAVFHFRSGWRTSIRSHGTNTTCGWEDVQKENEPSAHLLQMMMEESKRTSKNEKHRDVDVTHAKLKDSAWNSQLTQRRAHVYMTNIGIGSRPHLLASTVLAQDLLRGNPLVLLVTEMTHILSRED